MKNSTFFLCLVLQLLAVSWTGNHHAVVVMGQDTATLAEETATLTEEPAATDEETPMDLDEPVEATPDAAEQQQKEIVQQDPVQAGPLIDLLGPKLQSLQMVDEQNAQIGEHYTNEALKGKTVIGIYFSADW